MGLKGSFTNNYRNRSIFRFFLILFVVFTICFPSQITGINNSQTNEEIQINIASPESNSESFTLGETVLIRTKISGLKEILLQGPNLNYKYSGAINEIPFTPEKEGNYQVIILQEKEIKEKFSFQVLSIKNQEQLEKEKEKDKEKENNNENEENIVLENNFSQANQVYNLGESVKIQVNSLVDELIIESETSSYKYAGIPEKTIVFIPQKIGEYYIKLFNEGNNVQTKKFTVLEYNFTEGLSNYDSKTVQLQVQTIQDEVLNKQQKTNSQIGFFQLRTSKTTKNLIEVKESNSPFGKIVQLEKPIQGIEKIVFKKLEETNTNNYFSKDLITFSSQQNKILDLGIEDVEEVFIDGRKAVKSYAIDPTNLNFETATITSKAEGTALYECKDYNFTTQECYGTWTKKRQLVPGQEYTFSITPEDPLYSEFNDSIDCGCSFTQTSKDATIGCDVYCNHTIQLPSEATSFSLDTIIYNVDITMTSGGTIQSGSQSGYYDHDETTSNDNEILVGSATRTTSGTETWINNDINRTGDQSFNQDNCDNWPNYCNYKIYLDATLTFTTPGQSQKTSTVAISLNWLNYTLNYTEPGAFSVVLESPNNNHYTNSATPTFSYTPTSEDTNIENCSIFTNETSWSAKNTSTSINNGTINYITTSFSNDGSYLWNIKCWDENGQSTEGILNRTINIDTTKPTINLISPASPTTITNNSIINFYFNVTDATQITNCSLLIDGEVSTTRTDIELNTEESIGHYLSSGNYNWSIKCYDIAGNYNVSEERPITVNITPEIYTGLWYETSTSNCGTFPCEINLKQETDDTGNTVSGSIPLGNIITIVEAVSPFIGSNGAHIPSGTDVRFSSYISGTQGSLDMKWYLYKQSNQGANTLLCSNTDGKAISQNSAAIGDCTFSSNQRIFGSDILYYEITLTNTHQNQPRTFTHSIDHASSYVNIYNFTQIGSLSTALSSPINDFSTSQNTLFNLTCNVSCSYGSCLNTQVYAQTNNSGTWQNISTSGPVILSLGQNNSNNIGTVFNTTTSTTFSLNASNPGTTNIRCYVEDMYSTSTTESVEVEVVTSEAPTITLNSPENDTWVNTSTITFIYTPSTYDSLQSCSLYINGIFNQSNSTPITNNAQNNFTINNIAQADFNWSVSCNDSQGRQGNSIVNIFYVDYENPEVILYNPESDFETPNPDVFFNWTATDNRADNITCKIYINNSLEDTITQGNNTVFNTTLTMSDIGLYNWKVTCNDYALRTNMSETRNFTVTDQPPIVNLINPQNDTGVNTTSPTLYYNVTDYFGIKSCSLYINGEFNQTNSTPINNGGTNNFTVIGLNEELYNWSVSCTDINDNTAQTGTWNFYVDVTPLIVNLISPLTDTQFTQSTIEFSYNVTDNWEPLTCIIYVDDQPNITTNTTSGSTITETGTGYSDGIHEWYVECTDIGGFTNTIETRTFNLSQKPRITLDYPEDNKHLNTQNLILQYTPLDNDGINSCSLYINGEFNRSNTEPVINNQQNNFTLTNIAEGYYDWSVNCTDNGTYSNTNKSETRNFVIDINEPTIILIDPTTDQIVNTSTHLFKWNATDVYTSNLSCDLYLNDELNTSGIISESGSITNYTITGLRTGDYNWSLHCTDLANNTKISEIINFTVLLPPKIELVSPENDTGINPLNDDIIFTYIPSEGSGNYQNCSLILDGQIHQTSTDPILYEQENNFTIASLEDNSYEWNVQCTDTNDLTGTAPNNWTVYIDSVDPYNLTILNPENESLETKNNITFSFIVQDLTSPEMLCDIYLTDITENESYPLILEEPVQNNTIFNYSYLLSDGNYSWNVFCMDKVDLYIQSEEYYFEVIAPPSVTLVSPENDSWFNTDSVSLIYYPEDDMGISSCDLYINGEYNRSTTALDPAINKENNTFLLENLNPGEYNWTVECIDSDLNKYAPPNKTFYIDQQDPTIELHNPQPVEEFNTSSIMFNWTANDDLSPILYCDLYINNSLNKSNILVNKSEPHQETIIGFVDGFFNWNINCTDLANNSGNSKTRNFTVQEPPKVSLGNPQHNYRTNNTEITFFFTPQDNSGVVSQCTLILNGTANETNNNIQNGIEANLTVENLIGGNYTWDVNCTDPTNKWAVNGTPKNFHVDLFPPNIELLEPSIDETFNTNNITFKWTTTDFNDSVVVTCDIFVSDPLGDRISYGLTEFSGQNFTHQESNLEDGEHYWNVTCRDDLGNTNNSETRRFIINQPDLYIDQSRIKFNNTNPDLNENLNITVNVSNIGGVDATDVLVEFWNGLPNQGGIFLGNDTGNINYNTSKIFYTNWTITEGYHNIFVIVDPENNVIELNESNNNATNNISVLRSLINKPENNMWTNTNNSILNFTVQDYTGGLITYEIFLNGNSYSSGIQTDNISKLIQLNYTFEGIKEIIVQATDVLSRRKNSTVLIINFDETSPQTSFIIQNGTLTNDTTPEIIFNLTDNLASQINYTIFVDNLPEYSSSSLNPSTINYNLSILNEGVHEIIVEAEDQAGNKLNSTTITIIVDITPPNIELLTPEHLANFNSSNLNLTFNVTDNLDKELYCNITLNGNINASNIKVDNSSIYTHELLNLNEGTYNWNVTCWDGLNLEIINKNTSQTRTFNIFTPPIINQLTPENNYWTSSLTQIFTYNVSDDSGIENCSLVIDGSIVKTNYFVDNNAENNFTQVIEEKTQDWQIECYDNTTFKAYSISNTRNITGDVTSPEPNIITKNNTWFRTSTPEIDFILYDNLANNINYKFYVNNTIDVSGQAVNNTPLQDNLNSKTDGYYKLILEGKDYVDNKKNSSSINFYVDTLPPNIQLYNPEIEEELNSNIVHFNWTATDIMSPNLTCNLTVQNSILDTQTKNTGLIFNTTQTLSSGIYYWNVTCQDLAGNINTSETRNFTIPLPDLYINEGNISFSNSTPKENQEITIYANVHNIGDFASTAFNVSFYAGNPDTTGILIDKVEISSLAKNSNFTIQTNWTAIIGTVDIFVHVDRDDMITEDNETNNIAFKQIQTGAWHLVSGNVSGELEIYSLTNYSIFRWITANNTGDNIMVTDYDSNIDWRNLTGFVKTTTGGDSFDDFVRLDEVLQMTNLTDSINKTFAEGGIPKQTKQFTIFNRNLEVPVINSSNNENFVTGILWDSGDGGTHYDKTQDVIFITEVNKNKQGQFGIYDFEVRVPARLREYTGTNNLVAFYTELK